MAWSGGGSWSMHNIFTLLLLYSHTFLLLHGFSISNSVVRKICSGMWSFTLTCSQLTNWLCKKFWAPPPLTLVFPWLFLTSFCLLLCSSIIFWPFWNIFSQRCHRLGWWAQLWLDVSVAECLARAAPDLFSVLLPCYHKPITLPLTPNVYTPMTSDRLRYSDLWFWFRCFS